MIGKYTNSRAQRKDWWNDPDKPNSHCPMCGAPVWFFRNRNGGCAYFDALGKPWPLHPCMELQQKTADRQTATEVIRIFEDSSASQGRSFADAKSRLSPYSRLTSSSRTVSRDAGRTSPMSSPARSSAARMTQKPVEDQVLSWWTALSGLIAACVVLFAAGSMVVDAGFFSTILLMWLFVLPSALLGLSLAVFLVLVPRPRGGAKEVALQCGLVPVFVLVGVAASAVTLGIGPVAMAVRVIAEVPWAQAVASSSSYPAREVHR